MEAITDVLNKISGFVWGPPLLILLVGTGIFLTARLAFIQVRLLPYSLKQVFSRKHDKKSGRGHFTIPSFDDRNGRDSWSR